MKWSIRRWRWRRSTTAHLFIHWTKYAPSGIILNFNFISGWLIQVYLMRHLPSVFHLMAAIFFATTMALEQMRTKFLWDRVHYVPFSQNNVLFMVRTCCRSRKAKQRARERATKKYTYNGNAQQRTDWWFHELFPAMSSCSTRARTLPPKWKKQRRENFNEANLFCAMQWRSIHVVNHAMKHVIWDLAYEKSSGLQTCRTQPRTASLRNEKEAKLIRFVSHQLKWTRLSFLLRRTHSGCIKVQTIQTKCQYVNKKQRFGDTFSSWPKCVRHNVRTFLSVFRNLRSEIHGHPIN